MAPPRAPAAAGRSQRLGRSKRPLILLVVCIFLSGCLLRYTWKLDSQHSEPEDAEGDQPLTLERLEKVENDNAMVKMVKDHYDTRREPRLHPKPPQHPPLSLKTRETDQLSATTLSGSNNSVVTVTSSAITMSISSPPVQSSSTQQLLVSSSTSTSFTSQSPDIEELRQRREAEARLMQSLHQRCGSSKRGTPGPHSNLTFILQPDVSRLCHPESYDRQTPLLLILVFSSADRQLQRDKIRRSYASMKWSSTGPSSPLTPVQTLFIVSNTSDTQMQLAVLQESARHSDLLQVAHSFHHKERSHFHLLALHFVFYHCPRASHLVLLHDEHFVNVPHLQLQLTSSSSVLANPESTQMHMQCNVLTKVKALRDVRSPMHVSRSDWPRVRYPPHCDPGVAYLVNRAAAEALLFCAYHQPLLWMDAVFMTGVLPVLLNATLQPFWSGFTFTKMMAHHAFDVEAQDNIFLTEGALLDERVWLRLHQRSLLAHLS